MSFEALLNDLDDLRKAQPTEDVDGDEKIAAAAEEGEGEPVEDEDDEDMPLGKSMTAVIDGEEQEVIDGTELVKSLIADVQTIKGERATENEHLSKALGLVTDMLKEQGDMIKSLQDQVSKMADSGRGRKSTVAVDAEMAKSLTKQESPKVEDVLAKCAQAMMAGKISAMDVSVAEAAANRGMQVPAHILANLS